MLTVSLYPLPVGLIGTNINSCFPHVLYHTPLFSARGAFHFDTATISSNNDAFDLDAGGRIL